MDCKEALKTSKLLLRIFGALVSAVMLAEAILTFCTPEFEEFFGFCHWFGMGLLGLLVGGMGFFLEVRGSMRDVANQFQWFALNRIVLSVYYFWLGCWVMGGAGIFHTKEGLKTLAHVAGFISWAVALGDLLVSCTAECRPLPGAGAEKTATPEENPDSSETRSGGQEYGNHGVASFPTGLPPGPESIGPESIGVGVDAEAADPPASFQEPAGGWNGSAKPFGCA